MRPLRRVVLLAGMPAVGVSCPTRKISGHPRVVSRSIVSAGEKTLAPRGAHIMDQIHPDACLVPLLQRIASAGVHIDVFVNNVTITRATVLADLTFSGASPAVVISSDFSATGVVGHKGSIVAPPVEIVNNSGVDKTGYGYVITDNANTVLLAAANFDAPIIRHNTEAWDVVPILGDSSRFS